MPSPFLMPGCWTLTFSICSVQALEVQLSQMRLTAADLSIKSVGCPVKPCSPRLLSHEWQ